MRVTDQGVPVSELIAAVKRSLVTAGVSRESGPGDLQVESVRLVLNVVATEAAGARIDLRVPFVGMKLRVGAKVTRQDTHRIDITLKPPEPENLRETRGDIETALVDAIEVIRSAMASAVEGEDPWGLSAGEVEITFVITKEGTISLGAEGELSHEVTNKLVLALVPS